MRNVLFRLVLPFLIFAGATNAIAGGVSVLFVGNSLTEVNNLPEVFKQLSAKSPLRLEVNVQSITPGGAFLYDQWKRGQAVGLLQKTHPKFLVLQGQSTEPLSARQSFESSVRLFKAEADHDGATTVLFATWARPSGDPYYKEATSGGSPAAMQAKLNSAYASLAKNTGASLAPVGLAFERAQQDCPDIRLLNGTQHPSPAGTYLAAAVLFRAIFNASPLGSTYYASLPKETAIRLQRVADDIRK